MISSSIDPVIICGSIVLSKLWFEYGLSSSQIRTNDIRNVVLLIVVPLSIHHYIFWVWPMLSLCSHCHGIPSIWKPGWIVVEPISNIVIFSMIYVEHPASIGKFYKHYLHDSFVKHMYGRKKWLPLIHVHLMQVAAVNSRKHVFTSSGVIPSQSCIRAKYSMVW